MDYGGEGYGEDGVGVVGAGVWEWVGAGEEGAAGESVRGKGGGGPCLTNGMAVPWHSSTLLLLLRGF